MHQQRLFTRRADAGDLVQRAGADRLGALFAVGADREAVRFVAQALDVEQDGGVDGQRQLAAVGKVEDLASLAAMVRALGDADQRHVLDAQIL